MKYLCGNSFTFLKSRTFNTWQHWIPIDSNFLQLQKTEKSLDSNLT
uniref:Uncharacterized protein n=1 Tax=Arundo donax TaxID=35708 RepID=A0A0A9EGH1_ARUDO